jgi:CRISPR-associated endoribonuclease Cas6
MESRNLSSVILVLCAENNTTIPAALGPRVHATFLRLIQQFDVALAARLHNEPGYRPFTTAWLSDGPCCHGQQEIRHGHSYQLRLTFLDDGTIWNGLRTHFLESSPISLHLGPARFRLIRLLSTPTSDPTDWIQHTTWQTLATHPPRPIITIHFISPTVFSLGDRQFEPFPLPRFLWEGLLRAWNSYAPPCFALEKRSLSAWVTRNVIVKACQDLHMHTLQFSTHIQRGFLGTCQYELTALDGLAAQVTALAAFAFYSGIGYKTTMGMGQVRVDFGEPIAEPLSLSLPCLGKASRSPCFPYNQGSTY